MKLSQVKNIIEEIIQQEISVYKYKKKPKAKSSVKFEEQKSSKPPTKEEFQKLLTRKLKSEGYSDDEIRKLHPLVWIVIGATFVKWLDNQIDDE